MSNEIVKYMVGSQEVSLDYATVKAYLVAGNGNVTDQELKLYMELNKNRGLNPWLRESYLIKFGNSAATMIVGKDAILKKAISNPTYGMHEAGITVTDRQGLIVRRAGSMLLPREELVGGWCKVVKHTVTGNMEIMHEVSFDEYCLRGDDGKPKSNWKNKPATMIRKVALCQALREAFPEDTSGMYEAEEMGIDEKILPTSPVDIVRSAIDITPTVITESPSMPIVDAHNPMLDLLDLSDADFLGSNFTFNGKTKMVGQIKLENWKGLCNHDDEAIRLVAARAVELLDNSFLKELGGEDPFAGRV